jgi:protein-tyrosine-phosphatase
MNAAGFLMRILFVCISNVNRSKIAEEMFKNTKDVEDTHGDLVWHLDV